jgi:hypothetical protein
MRYEGSGLENVDSIIVIYKILVLCTLPMIVQPKLEWDTGVSSKFSTTPWPLTEFTRTSIIVAGR